MSAPNPLTPSKVTLHADREHSGIQTAIPLIMLAAGIAIFATAPLVVDPLLSGGDLDGFRPALRVVLAVVAGVAVGGIAEHLLKRTWLSGRSL